MSSELNLSKVRETYEISDSKEVTVTFIPKSKGTGSSKKRVIESAFIKIDTTKSKTVKCNLSMAVFRTRLENILSSDKFVKAVSEKRNSDAYKDFEQFLSLKSLTELKAERKDIDELIALAEAFESEESKTTEQTENKN
jgi:hypothetical protein